MKTGYWVGSGKYQITAKRLNSLIPGYGDVKDKGKQLERFRQASQVYYDLYNNGLCNRFAEVRTVIGVTPRHFGVHYQDQTAGWFCPEFLIAVESRFDEILLDAADEQNIEVVELSAHQRVERAKRRKGHVGVVNGGAKTGHVAV